MFKNIMVMGAGAIGCLFGGLISKAGYKVILIGKDWQIEKIKNNGLHIHNADEFYAYPEVYTEPVESDLILMTVKAYDTEKSAKSLLIKEDSVVLSLQNGIRNEEIIARIIGANHVVGGVTSQAALLVKAGEIRHTGYGETIIGEMDGRVTKRIKEIKSIFDNSKIETTLTSNIKKELWNKLIINAGINAIGAITGLENGYIYKITNLRDISRKVVREAINVANKVGINVDVNEDKVLMIAKRTEKNRSSMLQDIDRGKKTEIDEINGEIVRIGRSYMLNCDVNETLYNLIKAKEIYKE
ncbi:MAG: 2-dehydropantoate 2-reductase [Candidatus Methanoliparum thermophilum]|uniref:2-dehydropantoate 2-reductase n=1 Tax=Methanoliparum thermophilum TaxID=2491083 RepID=A0A520KRR8_METT2|nr:ketopantoate reductase family protein [Candidatus Methanoliparum sp. LAM-1]RZN64491.1 MAG: 2-dehydropantoate 2-reductase [Candidatus Methanoliparum thermophilum]BDC35919.1 2-dehydropantoate 2-reductase [Candidatus Methanoliparum sp. LAM-1]